MTNGMNGMNPQLQQVLNAGKSNFKNNLMESLTAAFKAGQASNSNTANTAPVIAQANNTAPAQSAPFAASAAPTSTPAAGYPDVGSQLTGGKDSIRFGDLTKKIFNDAGADQVLQRGELEAMGVPASSALALARGPNGGVKVGDLLDALEQNSTGTGWRREITAEGIDAAMKGLIDEKGGPRATTDLSANKPMTSDDFAGLVNESFGLMGQEPPTGDELSKLFKSFATDGKLGPDGFKDIANIDSDKTFSLTEAGGNILERLEQMRAEPAMPYPNVGSMLTGGAENIGVVPLLQKMREASGADNVLNMAELVGAGFPEEAARALDGIDLDELYAAFKEEAGPGWNPNISSGQIDEVLKGLIDARGGPRDVTNVGTTPMDFQGFKDLTKKAMEFSGLETPDDAMLKKMFDNIAGADGKLNKAEFEGGIADINPDDQSFSLTDAGAKLAALYEEIKAQTPEPSIGSQLTGGAEKMGLNALMERLFGKTGADQQFQKNELGILPPELEGMTLDELFPLFDAKATGPAWNRQISADDITSVIDELVQQRSDPREVVDFSTPWNQQKFVGFAENALKAAGKEAPGDVGAAFRPIAGGDNKMNEAEYSATFGPVGDDRTVRLKEFASKLLTFMQQMS